MKPRLDQTGVVTVASAQGERSHQEDRAVCEWIESPAGRGWLLAVFDGHRGAASSERASEALCALYQDQLKAQRGDAAKALRDVFISLNEITRDHLSGATATVVHIPAEAQVVFLAVL